MAKFEPKRPFAGIKVEGGDGTPIKRKITGWVKCLVCKSRCNYELSPKVLNGGTVSWRSPGACGNCENVLIIVGLKKF